MMDAKMKRWAKSLCANKYLGDVDRVLSCMRKIRKGGWDGIEF